MTTLNAMLPMEAAEVVPLGTVFWSEVLGTALLTLLGVGVVANHLLGKTKGNAGGWLLISFGWGLAVFAGVYVAWQSGAHLNPAVTVGIWASGADVYAPGVAITAASTVVYLAAEFLGAFLGAVVCWIAYKQHYDEPLDPAAKLGTFSTGPEIRSAGWNVLTEVIATFVLVSSVSASASATQRRVLRQISCASCSTHPARGKICWCSYWPTPMMVPEWSKTIARVLVVP